MTGNPYKKGTFIPLDPLDGSGVVARKGGILPEATPAEGWTQQLRPYPRDLLTSPGKTS